MSVERTIGPPMFLATFSIIARDMLDLSLVVRYGAAQITPEAQLRHSPIALAVPVSGTCALCVRGADPVGLIAGIRLLQAMGWRQGKGVGPNRAAPGNNSSSSSRRWGPEAGIGAENTPIYALPPKTDTHGLGFDPFKVCTLC